MSNALLDYFRLQRQVFCLCPKCATIHRLSDLHLFLPHGKPAKDWLDSIEAEEFRLQEEEERIEEKRQHLQERAREIGRRQAAVQVKKVDRVFSPRKLNADDAKVIFHPVDFLVFQGMKEDGEVNRLLILDRKRNDKDQLRLQDSVQSAVSKKRFEWQTLRVTAEGAVSVD
ncbi:MAG TPA: Holliday junction resolvase-like protein [bacterium]|jgi:predicted Holliday junction resolvase-like endonuclease|nr:Holliday junction resolvase-like protein [bacterium]